MTAPGGHPTDGVARTADGAARMSDGPGPPVPDPDVHSEGLRWVLGGFVTQSLRAATLLRLTDHLAEGPLDAPALAERTGVDPAALYRTLRLLAGVGFYVEDAAHRFAPTALGATLGTDGSLREWVLFASGPELWASCGGLPYSVETGRSAFLARHDQPIYRYLERHPGLRATFASAMTTQSAAHNAALLAAYDFGRFGLVADLGGGQGATLAAILHRHPGVRGVLFDRPEVVADPAPLRAPELAARCRVVAGDLFGALPPGADCYLLKRVLGDLDDADARAVLATCAAELAPGGRVLVVDQDPGPANRADVTKYLDVLFLSVFGGGHLRTEPEWRALLDSAGLRLVSARATRSPNAVFEAERR